MKLLLIISVAFSGHVHACWLQGTWRTDIERTSASVLSSSLLSDQQKAAVISTLDEFEAVFTCDTVTIRSIGDLFGAEVSDHTSRYNLNQLNDSTVSIVVFGKSGEPFVESAKIDSTGCLVIQDLDRGYDEFRCRLK